MKRLVPLGLAIGLLWLPTPALAKNYGQRGEVFPVTEVNLLQAIAARLHSMQASGEYDRLNNQLRDRTMAYVQRPTPVAGLTPATSARSFTYDPSMIVDRDIRDRDGRLIVAGGTRVNPLNVLPFNQTYVFFDADRKEELEYVLRTYPNNANIKLVMVKGAPIEAMKRYQRRFYFDQGGYLVNKLKIVHTPTVMVPAGDVLRLTEVPL
ncbi:MAG: type-F conjugative transfer system protein TraW [Betaproteobacteria bacterium]|nr:type-F conjugative transfer system protein TraW [Betaproteobacteria bacterium]